MVKKDYLTETEISDHLISLSQLLTDEENKELSPDIFLSTPDITVETLLNTLSFTLLIIRS